MIFANAIKNFYQVLGYDKNQIINPRLIKVRYNTLYLIDQCVNLSESQAIKQFLIDTKDIKHMQVREFIIDGGALSDQVF